VGFAAGETLFSTSFTLKGENKIMKICSQNARNDMPNCLFIRYRNALKKWDQTKFEKGSKMD